MKNRILKLLVTCCLLLSLTLCADSLKPKLTKEQANAYFTVFKYLYETDYGLNSESNYIAIDLSNVKLADTAPLIKLIQNFCDNNGYILLQDTFEGLKEKEYIKDLIFYDGFLISFNDIKLDDSTLVTSAKKWRSGDGAIGADYTVKKKNKLWEIIKTENGWIS